MRIELMNKYNERLVGEINKPNKNSKEIIFVMPGYGSYMDKSSNRELIKYLNSNKFNTFILDKSGCGKSEGNFGEKTISDWADESLIAIDFLKHEKYENISILGTSAGGLIAMAVALRRKDIKKLLLRCPVSDLYGKLKYDYGSEKLKKWKIQGDYEYKHLTTNKIDKISYDFFTDSKKHIMYDKVKKIKCPILIIHGTTDKTVPIMQSKKLAKNNPNIKLIEIEGADHDLYLEDNRDYMYKIISGFF